MSQFIELQRSRLEELDIIRQATSKRFRKNPSLIPTNIRERDDILSGNKERPFKETMLQKHELKLFQDKYNSNTKALNSLDKDLVETSLNKINDPEFKFEYFDSLLNGLQEKEDSSLFNEDLKSLYSIYSSSPLQEVSTSKKGKLRAKRKYVLSENASRLLNIDALFTPEEQFGKFLDLKSFHGTYLSLTKSDCTYIEYLRMFNKVPYEGVSNDPTYKKYIHNLCVYLSGFLKRIDPLEDVSKLLHEIESSFKDNSDGDVGKTDENGEVYCKACDRTFSKETVYKGHLDGKKHKKNAKKLVTEDANETEISANKYKEFIIKRLSETLKVSIEDTINNIERQEGMTERERMIELSENKEEESDYTTADSNYSGSSGNESSDDEDNELFKDLPLGADGTPIPFWLYKLQGLHHSYECEICGNMSYKGRISFEKHFSSVKHQRGLKFLGVDTSKMSLFANITKIDEAQQLWVTLKRESKLQDGIADDAIEVEDNEGNVMSERDYIQLKKQGII
ncbi:Pre-mRNA-splicing factor sap61 [Yamadazyma tenuis]|uniref:Matrin-type domain-containing protein n=1 Tax=Candida tenuis (strain ATCC 10573 / BCRC 21748 / CBS 615 / JCM 9827 / NBRC 10315 / NRRL Y-1498 / VKM Y-70) TaxID=590646 RepID=G3B5U3_CANTC|nr:uncharacterized protein CANTEDRAFT_135134 [Yamadazyma tenuis ATCC 10573]XP_006687096.1 uncharacterized protein CANTEDRAFT_135134 [Yamadazyma tenuis ATCC 10573]EGV63302.1 hypothetical protein CANTEDRAFT_135134 [Yamadazyma tenuis ATCC 10573]EGV63303.1 hypothetical protein CANTEDRAFT_135134 [Yamadazyma tenuis ATCC 10573]WEJ96875.1 Pre-mRNA-splicing factor sap61 [Yamadazyma tenuis]